MGTSTESDICKNIVQVGEFGFISDDTLEDFDEFIWENKLDADNVPDKFQDIGHGWKWIRHCEKCGKNNRLFGDKFSKVVDGVEHEVFVVNSSEYAIVGETWNEVFSDDRSAVELLISDFGDKFFSTEINDLDTVNQTG